MILVLVQTVNLDLILVSVVPCQSLSYCGPIETHHVSHSQELVAWSRGKIVNDTRGWVLEFILLTNYYKYLIHFTYLLVFSFSQIFLTSHHCCQQPLYFFDQITRILVLSLWRHLLNMETKLLLAKHVLVINITKLVWRPSEPNCKILKGNRTLYKMQLVTLCF